MTAEASKPKPKGLPERPIEVAEERLPTDPEAIEDFNARMFECCQRLTMTACPICDRRFRPEAFEKHSKLCNERTPGGPVGMKRVWSFPRSARSPSPGGDGVSNSSGVGSPHCFLTCYLCGSQYGVTIFPLHIPRCQRLWEEREAKKSFRKDRRPLPAMPAELSGPLPVDADEVNEFNKKMHDYWSKVSLSMCEICGRTFKHEAFMTHRKVCTRDNPSTGSGKKRDIPIPGKNTGRGKPSPDRQADRGTAVDRMPRQYLCYLCGRQYGSRSLLIHVAHCRKVWEEREALKPHKRDRRAVPDMPPELSEALPRDPEKIDEFNIAMLDHWQMCSLVPCEICGRKFTQEAFEVHERVCTVDKPGGPLGLRKTDKMPQSKLQARAAEGWMNVDAMPRQYMCYLCGRQYGSKSLPLHIPRCQKLWEDREALKPNKRDRRAVPDPPPELSSDLPMKLKEIDAFNEKMYKYWNKISLIECPICKRTFTEEAFESHQKVCTTHTPGGPLGLKKGAPPWKAEFGGKSNRPAAPGPDGWMLVEKMPISYMCYLCGLPYGSKSLPLHIPRCRDLWEDREALKPRKERKPVPVAPIELDEPLPTKRKAIAEFNRVMYEAWKDRSLECCPICKRTFRPEAFEKHRKVCTFDNPGGPLGLKKGALPPTRPLTPNRCADWMAGRPRAFTCFLCGQQYGSKSLHIHIPQCQKLWEEREARKDDEKDRRPLPEAPPELAEPLPTKAHLIDEFNNKMFAYWDQITLVGCQTCGRTFRPEALRKHQKACKRGVFSGRSTPGRGPGTPTPRAEGTTPSTRSASEPMGSSSSLCEQKHDTSTYVHSSRGGRLPSCANALFISSIGC
eukprot:evm.model.scf_51.3 EVM.evm.TU.scf_51.3   scf_51:20961-32029(+)